MQLEYCCSKRCHRAKRQQRQCSPDQALEGDLHIPGPCKPLINARPVSKSMVGIRSVNLMKVGLLLPGIDCPCKPSGVGLRHEVAQAL